MMNLTSDPWIPAVRMNGCRGLFSLHQLFAQAHELRDLTVKPHERIALMRLLLCITQAALDGPEDEMDWEACQRHIQSYVKDYLDKWQSKFELFGEGARFLQVGSLMPGKGLDDGNSATKLDLSLATGNNPTLFDNSAASCRCIEPVRAALNLLTFQCFSPGGRIGMAKWNGKDTPGNGSSSHAPCVPSCMVHGLLLGECLLDTVHLNLLTKEMIGDVYSGRFGIPIWEQIPSDIDDRQASENASLSYLGRLVPISRCVRLSDDGTIILANGLDYPIFPQYREATATIIQKKDGLALMPASTSRGLWRQLAPVTIRRLSRKDAISGPLALGHDLPTSDFGLWVGALITDKAKIVDLVEAHYRVPQSMLQTPGRLAYENGIQYAELAESDLIQAVKCYTTTLKIANPARDKVRHHYWTRVEQKISALFYLAQAMTPADELPDSDWGRSVHVSALEAYQQSCPRQTPRQIQAYALGLRRLNQHEYTNSHPPKTNKFKSNEQPQTH